MPRILIVDDEAHQCTVLGISFKRRGFDVETMTDWQAAMKRVAGQPTEVASTGGGNTRGGILGDVAGGDGQQRARW